MSEVPIIVGVGDCVNRSTALADAHEPLTLILNAIDSALKDTQLAQPQRDQLQAAIDSIDVVRTWTWPYDDLPSEISRRLGVDPRHRFYSDHSGNKPAKLFDEAARSISKGQTKVAVVTGGEALASCEQLTGPWYCTYAMLTTDPSDRMCCCQTAASSWMDENDPKRQLCLLPDRARPWKEYARELHLPCILTRSRPRCAPLPRRADPSIPSVRKWLPRAPWPDDSREPRGIRTAVCRIRPSRREAAICLELRQESIHEAGNWHRNATKPNDLPSLSVCHAMP